MLRTVDDWEAEAFAFRTGNGMASSAPVAAGGDGVVVPDAHLLFSADFARAGHDLVLRGDDGASFVVRDYFATDERARLFSPEGASLSPEVVTALAGPLAPGQYAQTAPTPSAQQAVGRVATVDGNVTIMRNGVALTPQAGDAVLKGDVLLTTTGALGVTFNDGSTLNLTANSRLVVNEFVYDPRGTANSQILDLVQGSLTFISGEVAHSGNMKIGTPVATMGIRGTVGGVTTASDGTVSFYIVQSERGAVLTDQNGNVLANVVQNGPLIVVRPIGPLQVLAQEVQKTPDQLATELAALQHIVNVKSVGDAIIKQFFQPDAPDQPHTQFQIDLVPKNDTGNPTGPGNGGDGTNVPGSGNVIIPHNDDGPGLPRNDHPPIVVPIPPDLPPVNFAPHNGQTDEDTQLIFGGGNQQNRISVFDADTAVLRVTLAATHGTLTLSGVAGLIFIFGNGCADALMTFVGPRAAIDAALNGLTFTPAPDYNGTATVSIVTSDGNSTTGPHTIEIDINPVNDAAALSSATVDRPEGDSRHALKAEGCLTVSDIDSPETFQPQDCTEGQYGSFSIDADGHWEYKASSAHNEFVEGQIYTDTFDVLSADGTATTVTVNITGTNDAPVIDTHCAVAEYVENGCATAIAPDLAVCDVDSATLSGARVAIDCNFVAGEDVLVFQDQNGIYGSYDADCGVLTLTGVASVADYEAALRSITYVNNSDAPSTDPRTVTFQVNDGADCDSLSNVGSAEVGVIAVNDAPEIDTGCAAVQFTENDCATPVAPDLTVSDVDSATLSGARVEIDCNFVAGEDVLVFQDQNGICGSYDADCGVLTLTGVASVADYEAALRSITYVNNSDAPSTDVRTVTFQVDDGADCDSLSNVASVEINVTAVNDAPVLTAAAPVLPAQPANDNISAGLTVAALIGATIADADAAALAGIAVIGAASAHGGWQFSTDAGAHWTDFGGYTDTSALLLAGTDLVRFLPDGEGGSTNSFTYVAWDQTSGTHGETADASNGGGTSAFSQASDTAHLTVTPPNEAPAFDAACYDMDAVENAPPGTVLGAVHATDGDNDSLTYSILCGNDDGAFAIDGEGRIIVTGVLDADECASRELTVGVSDGTLTDETTVHIAIQDVSEPATATLTSTAGVTISATGEGATLGFVLQDGDNVTRPGTQEDRIVLGYDMGDSHVIRNAAPMLGDDDDFDTIATAAYDKDGASHFTSILSDANDVVLSQTISLGEDANYFTTAISVFNGSGAEIDNVRFMRNFDPDQDQNLAETLTFDTLNDVLQNPDSSSPFAAIAAVGPNSGNQVVLVSEGNNWRASAFGFTNTDPYDSFAFDNPQNPNGQREDIAITLTNDLGAIPDGGFARIEFITTANVATNGANALVGTAGCDTIDGLAGNDLLFGLGGADTFVFKSCYGADTVADFSGHGGQHDVIDVADFCFDDFVDLQCNAVFDDILLADGSHAAFIDFGAGDTLTLKGVASNTLNEHDFIFHHGQV